MKKGKMIAAAGAVYFIAAFGFYCTRIHSNDGINNVGQTGPEAEVGTELAENQSLAVGLKSDILSQHSLPGLERMDPEDQVQYVDPLRVIKRIEALGLDTAVILQPGAMIAVIEEHIGTLDASNGVYETVAFEGTTSQELQQVIDAHPNVVVDIYSEQIDMSEPVMLHGNTIINGNGVRLCTEGVSYGFLAENADNLGIHDIQIDGGTEYGIYCADCSHIQITGNTIEGCGQSAISITGVTDSVVIRGNTIAENRSGAVYIAGNVMYGLIESNTIKSSRGNAGLMSGIAMTGTTQAECPHNIIIRNNKIEDNGAAGIYSDGAYMCYVLDNNVSGNQKEGISLRNGTVGFYLSRNTLQQNGGRFGKTDDELHADFVLDAGRMEDGSSKAKLAGIVLDNAAYNILENNNLSGNYGGGIHMPHTAVRNVIMGNVIRDNNTGQSDAFQYYGIALESEPFETQDTNVDCTADYENIICRNIVSGNHYSGIFIGEGCYINDVFDNIVMDAQFCGVEAISMKFNSILNNTTNCGVSIAFE